MAGFIGKAVSDKLKCVALTCLTAVPVVAAEASSIGRVFVRHGHGHGPSAWQLQAEQVALPAILQTLQADSGVIIHHSLTAEKPVSATCAADNLPSLLKCLLGESVNLVFGPRQGGVPSEVWILGSTAATKTSLECLKPDVVVSGDKLGREMEIQRLREQAGSNDPRQRGNALYALAETGADDVDDVLSNGLKDASALVREQALGGWVRLYGADAAIPELYQAINDPVASVRLRAVELSVEPLLLRQASQDSDNAVRQLAKVRLEELEN